MKHIQPLAFDEALHVLSSDNRNGNRSGTQAHGMNLAKTVRTHLGLTQREFSERYGLALTTVRNWEQGRSEPDAAAKLLLQVIAGNPEIVADTARQLEDA